MKHCRFAKSSQVRLIDHQGGFRRVSDVVRSEGAVCGIDAGFYAGRWGLHPKGSLPCGKLVLDGKTVREAQDSDPDGKIDGNYHAIYKMNGVVRISREIPDSSPGAVVEWGLKMGPRLLDAGKVCLESIDDLRWDVSRNPCPRVAVGILSDDRVIFIYDSSTTPAKLAETLKSMGCVEAIGCDGDSSASYTDTETGCSIGYRLMPNALLIMPDMAGGEPMTQRPRVYLSPSTQAYNLGVGDYGTEEYRMRQLAWIIGGILTQQGADVAIARVDLEPSDCVKESDLYKPVFHISIHSNSSPGQAGFGVEGFHWPGSVKGKALTEEIVNALSLMNPNGLRRVESNDSYSEIAGPDAVCAYVEVGFHDREDEAKWIMEKTDDIAFTMARIICRHLSLPEPARTTEAESKAAAKLAEIKRIVNS